MTFASFNMTILTLIFHFTLRLNIIIVQFTSLTQSCPALCDAMDYTPVHWVGDAIQPSYPLSSPSPPASGSFQMNQLFTSGGQSIGVLASSVLPMNTEDWSPLGWTGWISLQSKGLSRVFSNTTVQKINSSALSFLYSPTLTFIHGHWKIHSFD